VSRLVAVAAVLAGCVAGLGCQALNTALVTEIKTEASADGIKLAACVVGQVVGGNSNAAAIAVTCGIPLASDAVVIATQIAVALEAHPDAGVGADPATDRLTLALRLRAVH